MVISTTQLGVKTNCYACIWLKPPPLSVISTQLQINGLSELQVKQPKIWVASTNWFLQCIGSSGAVLVCSEWLWYRLY